MKTKPPKPARVLHMPTVYQTPPAEKPDWLEGEAEAFWDRNAPLLAERGHLDALFECMFTVLCTTWARLVRMQAIIAREGYTVQTSNGPRAHPLFASQMAEMRLFLSLSRSFYMTPASRRKQ